MFIPRYISARLFAWALVGVVAGMGYAGLTIARNGGFHDLQTALIFTGWLSLLLATFSVVAGQLSMLPGRLLQGRGGRPAAAGVALELACAGVAWLLFAAGLLVPESKEAVGHPVLEHVAVLTGVLAGLAAAAAVRVAGAGIWPATLLRRLPALALLVAAAMVLVMGRVILQHVDDSAQQPADPVVRTLVPNHERQVLLIGLDGADWRRIDALIADGRMPVMAKLAGQGVRSNLRTMQPTLSPVIWNTIATGVTPEMHGIHGFTEIWLPGVARALQGIDDRYQGTWLVDRLTNVMLRAGVFRVRPVTSRQRETKAVWNILSDAGLRVGVVNWFASWPSDHVNGQFISDNNPWRAAFMDQRVGAQVSAVAGVTWPPELLGELATLPVPDPGHDPAGILALAIFADLTEQQRHNMTAGTHMLEVARTIYVADQFAIVSGLRLLENDHFNLFAVYLSGIDNLSHRLGMLPGVVDRYYQLVDAAVGRLVAKADPGATVMIVSDHGWEYQQGAEWGHENAPDGIILLAGSGIQAGSRLQQVPSVLDVGPTLLALFGLPQSQHMSGQVLADVLAPAVTASLPQLKVSSYGGYQVSETDADEALQQDRNEETLQKLRALGYIR